MAILLGTRFETFDQRRQEWDIALDRLAVGGDTNTKRLWFAAYALHGIFIAEKLSSIHPEDVAVVAADAH